MDDCIFCKIVAGELPSDIIYQDDELIAFSDINPLAPVHILVVPKEHIASLIELAGTDSSIVAKMTAAANRLAEREDVSGSGYRLVINCGEQGGQAVAHLHMHLLGGRQLSGVLG